MTLAQRERVYSQLPEPAQVNNPPDPIESAILFRELMIADVPRPCQSKGY